MNDIQKKINEAHKMISIIPVSGDAVDVMAAVKAHLREAERLAAPEETEAVRDG